MVGGCCCRLDAAVCLHLFFERFCFWCFVWIHVVSVFPDYSFALFVPLSLAGVEAVLAVAVVV